MTDNKLNNQPVTDSITNHLGIDVYSRDQKRLISCLKKLKTTISASYNGHYVVDATYGQILVTTTLTEGELDDWLYQTDHGCEYVGVFTAPKRAVQSIA